MHFKSKGVVYLEIDKSIMDIIKQRKSIRSYDNTTLSKETMNSLEVFFRALEAPLMLRYDLS